MLCSVFSPILNSSFEKAKEWPGRKKNSMTAVIVFKIFGGAKIFSSKNGRKFDNDSNDWKKVIRFFRSGKDTNLVEGPDQAEKLKSLDKTL